MATKKTEGIVLFAFGKYTYYHALYNLAFSIKSFSDDVSITAFVDSKESLSKYCPDAFGVVDDVKEIERNDLYSNGVFDPGKLKVNIYKYLPYHYNLYLDVDAVCIKDIRPLIEELKQTGKYYCSHTVGYHTIDKGRKIESMQWAFADDIWEHYKLSKKTVLPAINSSLQFIVKGKEAESLYALAKENYEVNPIELSKLRMKWGGGQPDELYMNIALAMKGHDPSCSEVGRDGAELGHIHFAMRRSLNFNEVIERYYLQSYYGGKGFTSLFYVDWLDRMLRNMHRVKGLSHQYKLDRIIANKHADKK